MLVRKESYRSDSSETAYGSLFGHEAPILFINEQTEWHMSRRKVLGGLAAVGIATVGLCARGTGEPATKTKSVDIDKLLDAIQAEATKLLAVVKREQEFSKEPTLANLGEMFSLYNELSNSGEKIYKLTRPFARVKH